MSRKLAGLPVWAWGIAAAAGIVLGLYLRSRSKSSQVAVVSDPGTGIGTVTGTAPPTADSGAGINSDLLALVASSQGALLQDNATLAGLTSDSVAMALGIGSQIVNLWGQWATPPVYTIPSSPGGGAPPPKQPQPAPAPKPPTPSSPAWGPTVYQQAKADLAAGKKVNPILLTK